MGAVLCPVVAVLISLEAACVLILILAIGSVPAKLVVGSVAGFTSGLGLVTAVLGAMSAVLLGALMHCT